MRALLAALVRRIARWTWTGLAVGVSLLVAGFCMNMLVSAANGWKIPVATKPDEVLFTIGETTRAGKEFDDPSVYDTSNLRQPMKPGMRYTVLADRIAVSFVWLDPGYFPRPLLGALELIHVWVGSEALVSIGDIVMWTGALVGILPFSILAPRLLYLLFLKAFRRSRQSQKSRGSDRR